MNEKNKKPQIRFAGFTDDWEQRKLGEIGSLKNGMNMDKNALGYGYPFVNLQDIFEKSEVDVKNLGLVNSTEQQRQEYNLLKGDVLFVRSSVKVEGVGLTSLICNDISNATYSGFIIRFRSNIEINDTYKRIMFSIKTIREQILSSATSSANTNINQEALKEIKLSIPKFEEQTSIGNFFKQLDETIALHQRKYEKYKNLKISYLEKMFPKENEQFPELRFPEFTDAWEQRKLGEVVDFYSGLTYSPDNVVENGTLVLRSSNVHENQIVTDDNVFVSPNVVNSDNVQIGDIIVVVRNGSKNLIGKHARIQRVMPNTVIGAFMTGIRSSNPEFLSALLDTQKFNDEIDKNLGATINQITTGNFKQMEFYFPCEKEQTAIGHFFKQLDETITLHQRKAEKYKQIKQAYLEKMFV